LDGSSRSDCLEMLRSDDVEIGVAYPNTAFQLCKELVQVEHSLHSLHRVNEHDGIVAAADFRGLSENFSRANQLNKQDLVITLAAQDRPR
jgi:hypothetical protein